MEENLGVTRVSCSNSLHVRRQSGLSVKRLLVLDFLDHLLHVHLDFAGVFGPAPETLYGDVSTEM
jgi:hypothetical protein